ncbi:MAG: phosphatidate cytidylyltransferase [Firmicutes bacterium]|nr:phosphatidate cytidylyltransferase [Bacillota bacterium]
MIVGLPLLILVVAVGGVWLRMILLVLSVLGLNEFYRAFSGAKILPVHIVGYLFVLIYFLAIDMYLIVFAAFILTIIFVVVIFYQKFDVKECIVTIGGFFYVPFLLSFIYFVRSENISFVWLIFTSASASDTFAYLIGKKWGKHKMTNTASPGKSWEGCIAGVVGAAIIGYIYAMVAVNMNFEINAFNAVVISVVGAIFSQFGDLFASTIKRSVGIKDFGKVLPGHGGILDRFDGIMVSAAMVYMVMILL